MTATPQLPGAKLLHLLLKIVYPLIVFLLPTSRDKTTSHSLPSSLQQPRRTQTWSYLLPVTCFFPLTVNSLNPATFFPTASTLSLFLVSLSWLCFPKSLLLLGWSPKCGSFPESNQHRARQEGLPHLPITQLSQFAVAPYTVWPLWRRLLTSSLWSTLSSPTPFLKTPLPAESYSRELLKLFLHLPKGCLHEIR